MRIYKLLSAKLRKNFGNHLIIPL